MSALQQAVDTIVAGVLHDVVDDTGRDHRNVREQFGDQVAKLVAGVSKLSNINQVHNPSLGTDRLLISLQGVFACTAFEGWNLHKPYVQDRIVNYTIVQIGARGGSHLNASHSYCLHTNQIPQLHTPRGLHHYACNIDLYCHTQRDLCL